MLTPLPDKLGKTMKNILSANSIRTLEQLTMIVETSLLRLPGIGPKALKDLQEVMMENGFTLLKNLCILFNSFYGVWKFKM